MIERNSPKRPLVGAYAPPHRKIETDTSMPRRTVTASICAYQPPGKSRVRIETWN
jgi:hypothetical protein